MTNEELLQQAKDRVAQQTTRPGELCTYLNWDQLVEIGPSWKVVEVLEKAANLAIQIGKQEWWDLAYKRQEEAIQSAREEMDRFINPTFQNLIKSTTRENCMVAIIQNGKLVSIERVPYGQTVWHGNPINIKIQGIDSSEKYETDNEVVLGAIQTALSVGEIHFETCALSAGAKKRLLAAQEILKKLTAPGR